MLFKKALWHGLAYVFAFLLALAVTVAIVMEQFSSNVDEFFGTRSELLVSEDDGTLYSTYKPEQKYLNADGVTGNSKAIIQEAINIGHQEGAEGTVLLKNNGVLPLASSAENKTKVTLLGLRSHIPLLGSGMGVKVQGPMITLEDALSRNSTDWNNAEKWASTYTAGMDEFTFEGANYDLNPTTIAFYDQWNKAQETQVTFNDSVGGYLGNNRNPGIGIQEPTRAEVETAAGDSFEEYNDAAIVVLGRAGSESNDYLPGQVFAGDGNSEPLELATDEKDLLELAKDNFEKVIVLINSCNAMEIDDLKHDAEIDAILNISFPGAYGMLGVADILSGKVSPSGGLADINPANQLSAPAMMNMGDFDFSNAASLTRSRSANYIIEAEGIYVGYRYYETRYNDVVEGRGNASSMTGAYASTTGSWNYAEEVTYGFGYGLSYTTFTQEIVGRPVIHQDAHEITMDMTVRVTNTGDAAGKSIVQIYGQAPYTNGGVEKSAIQLLAFDKTDTLQPDASEELTVTVDLQNLASYDSTVDNGDGTSGTYIFDTGDYYFAIGNGAHDALNNVLAAKGKTTADRMDYDGDADLVFRWHYQAAQGQTDTQTFALSRNNVRISNQIPYADFNYYKANEVTYLSRNNWQTTYPKTYSNVEAPASMLDDLNGHYYEVKTTDDTSGFTWGSTETEWKFYQMTGADWDDYRWEEILDQMTINESMYMAAFGGPTLPSAATIGFEEISMTENNGNGIVYRFNQNLDPNAPWAIPETDKNAAWNGQVFGASPLLASTFNPDLFKIRGEFVGTESLFLGVPIIWGPGLNTHRQAYNGRNCEYYSEDPVLSGIIAMEFSYGCAEYGLIAAPKHFAFNDQETNRNGVAPFMTEQRAREVELRAYQIAIEAPKYAEEGFGMFGLMTSFSKIGAVECTASRGLMTDILKEEWGFHGYAVTDIFDDTDLYTSCVYAGITGYDLRGSQNFDTTQSLNANSRFRDGSQVDPTPLTADAYAGDAAMMQALKDNNKNLLWAICQSNLMNRYNASTHVVWQMTSWRAAYIAAITVTAVLTAGMIALYVISVVKTKEGK